MPSPFLEDFSSCVEGQPVTSDNTVFDPVVGGGQSVLNPNSTFETGIAGWGPRFVESVTEASTEQAHSGVGSMKLSAPGHNLAVGISDTSGFAIEALDEWWMEAWFYPVSGVTRIRIRMFLYDADDVFLDQLAFGLNTPSPNKWYRDWMHRDVIIGVNDTATQAIITVELEGDSPVAYVDDVVFRYSEESQLAVIAAQARPALFGLGPRITDAESGGAPWKSAGLFTDEVTGQRRLFFRSFIATTGVSGADLTYMWLSAPNDNAPIMSIGVSPSETLVGAGLTLSSGSVSLGTFLRWHRVDVTVTESGDDLLVTADLYGGLDIYSLDPERKAGQLTGTIAGGAALLAGEAWLWLGRETGTTPTTSAVLVDYVSFDALPQPVVAAIESPPGFFVSDSDRNHRVELLGQWNGSTYDELEFLGRWNGAGFENVVPLIDTLWLETWPTNGAIGPPWSVNGQPLSVSAGRTVALAGGQIGRAVRAGPVGSSHFGALSAQVSQSVVVGAISLDLRLKDPGTPTVEGDDSYLRIGISGSSALALGVFTVSIETPGTTYSIIVELDYTQFYDLAVRLVGNEARGYINDVLIGSFPLSTAQLADLGTDARLVVTGPATVGPLRTENL